VLVLHNDGGEKVSVVFLDVLDDAIIISMFSSPQKNYQMLFSGFGQGRI
jgi:hypothetical protein